MCMCLLFTSILYFLATLLKTCSKHAQLEKHEHKRSVLFFFFSSFFIKLAKQDALDVFSFLLFFSLLFFFFFLSPVLPNARTHTFTHKHAHLTVSAKL